MTVEIGRELPAKCPQSSCGTAQETRSEPLWRLYGKLSGHHHAKKVNYKVPLALRMAKYKVHVSKKRNLRSEHLRGAPHHLSEHLAG
jgi:hypothetical protein